MVRLLFGNTSINWCLYSKWKFWGSPFIPVRTNQSQCCLPLTNFSVPSPSPSRLMLHKFAPQTVTDVALLRKLVNRLPLCFRHPGYLHSPPQGEWDMDRIIHKKTTTIQKPTIWYPYPPPPPFEIFAFSSCPWRLDKITFTPEDVEEIWVFPLCGSTS